MAKPQSNSSIASFLDVGAKLVAAIAIPVATFVIDMRLKEQTTAIQQQKDAFEQSIKTREKNFEAIVKFYELIDSKRFFSCVDDNTSTLLDVFVSEYNNNNKNGTVVMDGPAIKKVLVNWSLTNPNCQASQDSKIVKDTKGDVPTASSSPAGGGLLGTLNAQIRLAADAVSGQLKKLDTNSAKTARDDITSVGKTSFTGGDGWVGMGKYHERLGFANFVVAGGFTTAVADANLLHKNAILKARSPVYLRFNTSDTDAGGNPILGVLSEGTCIKVVNSYFRTVTWAFVTILDSCPAGQYS